jgi:hypothetical protein
MRSREPPPSLAYLRTFKTIFTAAALRAGIKPAWPGVAGSGAVALAERDGGAGDRPALAFSADD